MTLRHPHDEDHHHPPAWDEEEDGCPEEPEVRLRAITVSDLPGYLQRLANPPQRPLLSPNTDRRAHQPGASFLDGQGHPGASAMAEYRRRRAGDWHGFRRSLPQRVAGVIAAGVGAGLLTAATAGPGLARLTGPAAAGLGWCCGFAPRMPRWPGGTAPRASGAPPGCSPRWSAMDSRFSHDLALPRSPANVDHLVVGPTGVYVVDSKRYRGHLHYTGGRLWHGHHPLDRTLQTVWWEATRVAEHLAFGPDLHLYPVLCVHVARLPWLRELLVDGIPVLDAGALRPALQLTRQALSPEQVGLIAGQVRAGFRPAA